ncbi:MAG: chromate efflux transporter [Thiolinea sp.]
MASIPTIWEIFRQFFWLGCISFGGPAAHIGYFRTTFVERLHWLDDKAYASLVALCQFLPGPASSQVGFSIGLRRGGLAGGIAAFVGFTLPSFVLMFALAVSTTGNTSGLFSGIVSGLKLLAIVVVADAVVSMFRTFCKDTLTVTIAVLTAMSLWLVPDLWTQLIVLAAAALAGFTAVTRHTAGTQSIQALTPIRVNWLPLGIFIALFTGLPLLAFLSGWLSLFDDFFRTGSLVFGGGHVVLPLLQQMLTEVPDTDRFLLGYAAAQAVPGPMFTLATFLGAEVSPGAAISGALLATLAIFLPGFLLILALQGAWEALAARPSVTGAISGLNAAVVGLLMAALYYPVFSNAVAVPADMALVLGGYMLLTRLKLPVVWLVVLFAVAGLVVVR